MAHHHHHEDSDTYYLDQLCLVALSAAFGGVCLSMYTWQRPMLNMMLAAQFHVFVLASGILLTALALIRAVVLWKAVGMKPQPAHVHNHEHAQDHIHDHAHDHAHGECSHSHVHSHEHTHAHAHGHEHVQTLPHTHAHAHDHDHDHGHDHDHDHDWAPWRYVILLVPIILFLLGLPNKPPEIRAEAAQLDMSQEGANTTSLVGALTNPVSSLAMLAGVYADSAEGPALTVRFSFLEEIASSPESRAEWAGKPVRIIGQYMPLRGSDRQFTLVRLKIRCCAADVIPLKVPMICKEKLPALPDLQWAKVTGRIEFRQVDNTMTTVLIVPSAAAISATPPESNPYEQ
ncbi:MAG: hypothetical protein FJ271_10275 [Planctomycetes bacterium]|nr:hypothetical protein [Planctomycetota bacterium]